jgi:hypothetical protein
MLHVFYRDPDNPATGKRGNNIQHIFDRGGEYVHDIWPVDGPNAVPAGDLAAMNPPFDEAGVHAEHIFYRDKAHQIRHIWWSQGGGFKHDNWTERLQKLGISVPPAAGDPAAVYQSVFYRDEAGIIHHIEWSERHGFSYDIHWNAPVPAVDDPAVLAWPP